MKMANLYTVKQILLNSVAVVLTKTANMDDKKTEKITERLPLKNNEILDEKLNRVSEELSTIENNNRMGINQIKEDINSIKC